MLFSTVVPVSNLDAYNYPPILLLKLILSTCSSRYARRLEICLSCGIVLVERASVDGISEVILVSSFTISFYDKPIIVYFSSCVSYDMHSVSSLI